MARKKYTPLEKFAYRMTQWIGTTNCLTVHTVLFLVAFIAIPVVGFDRVLNIVTNVVSLEAIYMAIFIQMAVNRSHANIKTIKEHTEDILEDTEDLTEEDKNDAG